MTDGVNNWGLIWQFDILAILSKKEVLRCGIKSVGKKLFSKDAKKCYTHLTAAALRVKDYTLQRTETLRENCEDIYEDAKDINEDRKAAEEAIFEDTSATYKEVKNKEE